MVNKITISIAIAVLKRLLVLGRKRALETPSMVDDVVLEALEAVVGVYENGSLGKLIGR